jgi:hypothetical protein
MTVKNFVAGARSNNGVVNVNQVTLKNVPTIQVPGGASTLEALTDVISNTKTDHSTVVWEESLGYYVVEPLQLDYVPGNIDGGNYDGQLDALARTITIKTSSVANAVPNATFVANTSYISPGELAYNLTDNKLYTSNGTGIVYVGANQANMFVSGTLTVSNVHAGSINANNSTGGLRQVLSADGVGGIYWGEPDAAGANTQIQFNDSALANGSPNFTFDKVRQNLFVGNTVTANYVVANAVVFVGGNNASRPATPVDGTVWFNDEIQQLQIYLLNNWLAISTAEAITIHLDYGLLGDFVTTFENYGFVSDPATNTVNYGSI